MIDAVNEGIQALTKRQTELLRNRDQMTKALAEMDLKIVGMRDRIGKTDRALDDIAEVLTAIERRVAA